jgi:CheY-like chemotaxis protein
LGLATVYSGIKDLHGSIDVESELNSGTTFNLYLHLVPNEKPIGSIDKEQYRGSETILLVDDERQLVNFMQRLLEDLGYQVTSFTSSAEALTAFSHNSTAFDFVLTDMTMPELSGVQLAQKILEIAPQIPIVICTGFSEKINVEGAERLGIKAILHKPVSRKDVAACIRTVLAEKE